MEKINWGIIGCGDVTEVKSGPAFNKVPGSSLVAVMRRDAAKAADYAKRHQVPKWYSDANELINDPEVNAVYIATPPGSHEAYAIDAIHAGKPVYVEKPMALDAAAAERMTTAAAKAGVKLSVAHYRREQPLFKKIKSLLAANTIGEVRLVELSLYKTPFSKEQLENPHFAWRVNPALSGGGLFHDLAPHQLDILYHFFGPVKNVKSFAFNQAGQYAAHDLVSGTMLFENGVVFNGSWCFNAAAGKDTCVITGSRGEIRFSMFDYTPVEVTAGGIHSAYAFEPLQHVQQPMIEAVVNFFLGKGPNPCCGNEGTDVMRLVDAFVSAEGITTVS
ncbi:MAG: Gfo/Idh/MocA family oxidoreductase [Ferruginibacter sp.]